MYRLRGYCVADRSRNGIFPATYVQMLREESDAESLQEREEPTLPKKEEAKQDQKRQLLQQQHDGKKGRHKRGKGKRGRKNKQRQQQQQKQQQLPQKAPVQAAVLLEAGVQATTAASAPVATSAQVRPADELTRVSANDEASRTAQRIESLFGEVEQVALKWTLELSRRISMGARETQSLRTRLDVLLDLRRQLLQALQAQREAASASNFDTSVQFAGEQESPLVQVQARSELLRDQVLQLIEATRGDTENFVVPRNDRGEFASVENTGVVELLRLHRALGGALQRDGAALQRTAPPPAAQIGDKTGGKQLRVWRLRVADRHSEALHATDNHKGAVMPVGAVPLSLSVPPVPMPSLQMISPLGTADTMTRSARQKTLLALRSSAPSSPLPRRSGSRPRTPLPTSERKERSRRNSRAKLKPEPQMEAVERDEDDEDDEEEEAWAANALLQLQVNFQAFIVSVGKPLEVHVSVYSARRRGFLSEPYVLRLTESGMPEREEMVGRARTVFRDLLGSDLQHGGLHLVARFFRRGGMHMDSVMPPRGRHVLRRPFGCAVLPLETLDLAAHVNEEVATAPDAFQVYECAANDESCFSRMHERLIFEGAANAGFKKAARAKGIALGVTVRRGRLTHSFDPADSKEGVHARRLRMPAAAVQASALDRRNDLYIFLTSAKLTCPKRRQPNVELVVTLRTSRGQRIPGVIMRGAGDGAQRSDEYVTPVFYHSQTPAWGELIKVSFSNDEALRLEDAHLLFEMRHMSSKKTDESSKAVFSSAFLPICSRQGTILDDGVYSLRVFEPLGDDQNASPGFYLNCGVSPLASTTATSAKTPELEALRARSQSNVSDMDLSDVSRSNTSEGKGKGKSFFGRRKKKQQGGVPMLHERSGDFLKIETLLTSTTKTQRIELLRLFDWQQQIEQARKGDDIVGVLHAILQVPPADVTRYLREVLHAVFSLMEHQQRMLEDATRRASAMAMAADSDSDEDGEVDESLLAVATSAQKQQSECILDAALMLLLHVCDTLTSGHALQAAGTRSEFASVLQEYIQRFFQRPSLWRVLLDAAQRMIAAASNAKGDTMKALMLLCKNLRWLLRFVVTSFSLAKGLSLPHVTPAPEVDLAADKDSRSGTAVPSEEQAHGRTAQFEDLREHMRPLLSALNDIMRDTSETLGVCKLHLLHTFSPVIDDMASSNVFTLSELGDVMRDFLFAVPSGAHVSADDADVNPRLARAKLLLVRDLSRSKTLRSQESVRQSMQPLLLGVVQSRLDVLMSVASRELRRAGIGVEEGDEEKHNDDDDDMHDGSSIAPSMTRATSLMSSSVAGTVVSAAGGGRTGTKARSVASYGLSGDLDTELGLRPSRRALHLRVNLGEAYICLDVLKRTLHTLQERAAVPQGAVWDFHVLLPELVQFVELLQLHALETVKLRKPDLRFDVESEDSEAETIIASAIAAATPGQTLTAPTAVSAGLVTPERRRTRGRTVSFGGEGPSASSSATSSDMGHMPLRQRMSVTVPNGSERHLGGSDGSLEDAAEQAAAKTTTLQDDSLDDCTAAVLADELGPTFMSVVSGKQFYRLLLTDATTLLWTVLGLMSPAHIDHFLQHLPPQEQRSLVCRLMRVCMRAMRLEASVYASHWLVLRMFQVSVIASTIQRCATALIRSNAHGGFFDMTPWSLLLQLCFRVVTLPALREDGGDSLDEGLALSDRQRFVASYGNLRALVCTDLSRVWKHLGNQQVRFVEPVLAVLPELIRSGTHSEKLGVMMCADLLRQEFRDTRAFKDVEAFTINALYAELRARQAQKTKGGARKSNTAERLLSLICEGVVPYICDEDASEDRALQAAARAFAKHISHIYSLMRRMVQLPDDERFEDERTAVALSLMDYLESKVGMRQDMFLNYAQYLVQMHLRLGNYVEAGVVQLQHLAKLDWSNAQKPSLVRRTIRLFDRAEAWERALELCEQLQYYYRHHAFDYERLSNVLRLQARFYKKILTRQRLYARYYRVVCYGPGFAGRNSAAYAKALGDKDKAAAIGMGIGLVDSAEARLQQRVTDEALADREFVFRGVKLESVMEFVNRIKSKWPRAKIIMSSDRPSDEDLAAQGEFAQAVSVTSLDISDLDTMLGSGTSVGYLTSVDDEDHASDEASLHTLRQDALVQSLLQQQGEYQRKEPNHLNMPEKLCEFRRQDHVQVFSFDKPVQRAPTKEAKKENEFRHLWIQRTFLLTRDSFPGNRRRIEVVQRRVVMLHPVVNAVESVRAKNREIVQKSKTVEQLAQEKRKQQRESAAVRQRQLQRITEASESDAESDVESDEETPTPAKTTETTEVDVGPLSMVLSGCLDAVVNGGTTKFIEAFILDEAFKRDYPHLAPMTEALRHALREQLEVSRVAAHVLSPE
ncbi:MAG: hypothetical protein MHM6MM_004477 [Cercozoa sp. M6MM]